MDEPQIAPTADASHRVAPAVGPTNHSPSTPTPGPAAANHSALKCLVMIAAHHGLPTTLTRILHDHALGAEEPATAALVRIARQLGLKARSAKLTWSRLIRLGAVFPVVARLTNGNSVIVVGSRGAGADAEIAVVDPLANRPEAFFLTHDQFTPLWQGDLVFLRRPASLTDENQPFGLAWFIPELWRQRGAFRDVAIAALTLHALGILIPVFFQLVIDKVLVHYSYSTLYVLTVGVVVVVLFEAMFGFLRRYLLLSATNKIDVRLTTRTFSHLLALPIDYFERSTAGVTVRHMQQTEKIRQFLTGRLFLTALDATALLVFVPVLFFYSPWLTLVVLVFAALMAAVVLALVPPFQSRLRALYDAEARRQAMLVETIHGMRTVKASAIEPVQRRKWDQSVATAIMMHFRVGQISIAAQAITQCLERLMVIALIALGAMLVFDQTITVGALVAFQMLSGRVIQPLVQIVSLVHEYQETALSVRMLGQVMNQPPERRPGQTGLTPVLRGEISFDRVSFRYRADGPPVLDQVSLKIAPGAVVGVVGRSGSGKTTLTRLIQGFYVAPQGVLRIDGIDIREIDLAHLRLSIGVVLQENFLFRGSVRENIAVTRPDAPFHEIVASAQLAGAHEFIEQLPQGYDTPLEENATNLSGGQRQRLAIARALLTRPRLLIFDEATSALDPDSEAIVMNNLGRIAAGRTVILVSHRLSMLAGCNAIVVMEGGRIVDTGRHEQLLQRCTIYQDLWQIQNRHHTPPAAGAQPAGKSSA